MSAFDPVKCLIATASPMCSGVGCRPFETAKVKSCAIDVIFLFVLFESDKFLSRLFPMFLQSSLRRSISEIENQLSGINSTALNFTNLNLL